MCRLRVLNDAPVTMEEREFGGNHFHSMFNKTASEAEVLSMFINGAEPYRKKKAITKIFRRSKYLPKLEDIEEDPGNFEKEEPMNFVAFDLSSVHLERAISAGIMAQESRRKRRKSRCENRGDESPRSSPRRERRRASRRAIGEQARS